MRVTKKDIGKRIEFFTVCRWNNKKAVRVLRGIDQDGSALVCFGGWRDFIVKPNEIKRILGEER